jgi:hypothetical protein
MVFETVQLSRTELESLIRLFVNVRVEAGAFSSAGAKRCGRRQERRLRKTS